MPPLPLILVFLTVVVAIATATATGDGGGGNKIVNSNKSLNFSNVPELDSRLRVFDEISSGQRSGRHSSDTHLMKPSKGKYKVYKKKRAKNNKGSNTSKGVVLGLDTNASNSARAFEDDFDNPLPRFSEAKLSPIVKSSWLAVANSMAESEQLQQIPMTDESKPTKYHYYPHNQHLYLLPECATQQVCSAVYLRLNYSQPLCACPSKPCSVSTRTDDRHTIPLVTGAHSQVLTLVKTCEPANEVRECNKVKDWSILALQNSRTGKAHYLVICRCPSPGYLEGPIAHSQPAYARVPGIRVYGMTCVRQPDRSGRDFTWLGSSTTTNSIETQTKIQAPRGPNPKLPWTGLKTLLKSAGLIS